MLINLNTTNHKSIYITDTTTIVPPSFSRNLAFQQKHAFQFTHPHVLPAIILTHPQTNPRSEIL